MAVAGALEVALAAAHERTRDDAADVVGLQQLAHDVAQELSSGKDTPSGHWEIAGVPVLFEWGYFHDHHNSFPQELLDAIVRIKVRFMGLPLVTNQPDHGPVRRDADLRRSCQR